MSVTHRRPGALRVLLTALCGVAFVCVWLGLWSLLDLEDFSEVGRFERYASSIAAGETPYRDFPAEYPPGALAVFLLPKLLSPIVAYDVAFQILLAACGFSLVAITVVHLRSRGEGPLPVVAAAMLAALAPFVLRQAGLERFDLWPATLSAAAVALVAAARYRLGAVLLGIAVAVKLDPLVIVPLALLHVWRRRGREAAVFATLTAGVVLAFFLPLLLLAPVQTLESVGRQGVRPLQLESLGASIALAAHVVSGVEVETEESYGSVNLLGRGTQALAGLSTAALVAALIGICVMFARSPGDTRRLVLAAAAAVTALLAFGKVLSPQFLLWSIALVALVPGCRRIPLALIAGAVGLTALFYPAGYGELAGGETAVVAVLLARNVLLLALLGILVRELSRRRLPEPDSSHPV